MKCVRGKSYTCTQIQVLYFGSISKFKQNTKKISVHYNRILRFILLTSINHQWHFKFFSHASVSAAGIKNEKEQPQQNWTTILWDKGTTCSKLFKVKIMERTYNNDDQLKWRRKKEMIHILACKICCWSTSQSKRISSIQYLAETGF